MKGRIYLLSLVLLFSCSWAMGQNTARNIDSLITLYHKDGKFTGTILVAKEGEVILKKGYGYKNTVKKQKNDGKGIFQLGSVSKTFTSTMILMLQEEGKLNVKDKLSKYFPAYPDGDKITIENLLTHTSGIFNYTEDTGFIKKDMFTHQGRQELIALFKDRLTGIEPGTKFDYSNSNYMLLGYIIEDLTGMSYYKALREMILKPLGMKNTGCNFAGLKSADKVTGYFAIDDEDGLPAPFVDSSVSYAAGAIYSTADDMYKWAQAVIDGKLLRPVDWIMATREFKEKYGYGWMVGELYGKKSIGHNGGVHGFVSNFFLVPDDKVVVVMLSNDMSADLSVLRRGITALLYDKPYEFPKFKPSVKLDAKTLKEYVAEYELAPGFYIKIFLEGDKLMGQVTGQTAFRMYAERKDLFFLKVTEAQISFVRNNNGRIDKLLLRQNGKITPAERK